MKNFRIGIMALLIATLWSALAQSVADDVCSDGSNQSVGWYRDKLVEEEDYLPAEAYDKCVTKGAAGWRNACTAEERAALRIRLDEVAAKANPKLDVELSFMVDAT